VAGSKAIKAQIMYSLEEEMALTKEDIFERRLSLLYEDIDHHQAQEVIEEYLSKVH